MAAGVLVVGILAGLRADEKQDDKKDDNGKLLVGKWGVVKGTDNFGAGSTVEFSNDGKMVTIIRREKNDLKFEATYKVEGEKLIFTNKRSIRPIERTIRKLTDKKLTMLEKDIYVLECVRKK